MTRPLESSASYANRAKQCVPPEKGSRHDTRTGARSHVNPHVSADGAGYFGVRFGAPAGPPLPGRGHKTVFYYITKTLAISIKP